MHGSGRGKAPSRENYYRSNSKGDRSPRSRRRRQSSKSVRRREQRLAREKIRRRRKRTTQRVKGGGEKKRKKRTTSLDHQGKNVRKKEGRGRITSDLQHRVVKKRKGRLEQIRRTAILHRGKKEMIAFRRSSE